MGEFMGLSVNEGVKSYLQWLGREYEFCYMFTGEKFGLVNNLNLLKKPVLILGPEDDSEKYKGIMRLWAYGGSIGTIDTESGDIDISSESKNYLPYLSDGFRNKKKYPEEFWQEGLFCELDTPACQKYAKLLKAHDRTSGRIDKLLLDLSVFAAYTRFLSRKEYKTYPSYPQEKSIQCVIAKYSMLNSVWKENADSLVVIDVETHLFKQGGRHPRADFAVFDGNAFGLVEFKYLGDEIRMNIKEIREIKEDADDAEA